MTTQPERLNPSEQPPAQGAGLESASSTADLTARHIEQLFSERRSTLEQVKSLFSLKFYYAVAEKIRGEEQKLKELLHLETRKQEILSHYSFVLDSRYFEQRFLHSEI